MITCWKSSHGGHIVPREIRFLLAHKCQGSLHFSACELGHRGAAAGLQSIREVQLHRSYLLFLLLLLLLSAHRGFSSASSPPGGVSDVVGVRLLH